MCLSAVSRPCSVFETGAAYQRVLVGLIKQSVCSVISVLDIVFFKGQFLFAVCCAAVSVVIAADYWMRIPSEFKWRGS